MIQLTGGDNSILIDRRATQIVGGSSLPEGVGMKMPERDFRSPGRWLNLLPSIHFHSTIIYRFNSTPLKGLLIQDIL